MLELKMMSCNHLGEIKFKYGEHTLYSNAKKIFKWKSETLDKNNKKLKEEIDSQILNYHRLMNKGAKRFWVKKN